MQGWLVSFGVCLCKPYGCCLLNCRMEREKLEFERQEAERLRRESSRMKRMAEEKLRREQDR